MMNARKFYVWLMLCVYSIVFAHGIVPHHHHNESDNQCESSIIDVDYVTDSCCSHGADTDISDLSSSSTSYPHCHFEVKPVLRQSDAFPLLANEVSVLQLVFLASDDKISNTFYKVKHTQGAYHLFSSLRAPPEAV